jgi:hypothetical protein
MLWSSFCWLVAGRSPRRPDARQGAGPNGVRILPGPLELTEPMRLLASFFLQSIQMLWSSFCWLVAGRSPRQPDARQGAGPNGVRILPGPLELTEPMRLLASFFTKYPNVMVFFLLVGRRPFAPAAGRPPGRRPRAACPKGANGVRILPGP